MQAYLKRGATFCFIVLAIPLFLWYRCKVFCIGSGKAFTGSSQFVSIMPGLFGAYFRKGFYALALKRCAGDCHIEFGTIFSHPSAEIGSHVYIGSHCTIGDVRIGDQATIGSNVDIMNGRRQHGTAVDVPVQEQAGEYPRVFIGEDAWIGNSAVIMANVGKKAIVGAGSVVVGPVDDYEVVAGNPAVRIKKRQ